MLPKDKRNQGPDGESNQRTHPPKRASRVLNNQLIALRHTLELRGHFAQARLGKALLDAAREDCDG